MKRHLEQRDHQCPICRNRFFAAAALRTHIKTVHNQEKNFPCILCGKRCSQRGNLKVSSYMCPCTAGQALISSRATSTSSTRMSSATSLPSWIAPRILPISSPATTRKSSLSSRRCSSTAIREFQAVARAGASSKLGFCLDVCRHTVLPLVGLRIGWSAPDAHLP